VRRRPLLVWLAHQNAVIAHREQSTGTKTDCGLHTVDGDFRSKGLRIDWSLLNPKRVRLCQKCWSPIAVKLAADLPNLPPCELAS